MNEREIGKILISTFSGLMRDRHYAHISSVKGYSHLTEDGTRVMMELIHTMAPLVAEAQHQADQQRAENIMMDRLKK